MDETLSNMIFSNLLRKLMEQNKIYNVTIESEVGDLEFKLILDEDDQINIYDSGQIGTS